MLLRGRAASCSRGCGPLGRATLGCRGVLGAVPLADSGLPPADTLSAARSPSTELSHSLFGIGPRAMVMALCSLLRVSADRPHSISLDLTCLANQLSSGSPTKRSRWLGLFGSFLTESKWPLTPSFLM